MPEDAIWEWPRAHRGTVESQFYLQSSNLQAMSPYTGQVTPYGPNFQRFVAKLTFPTKRGPDWRELSGIIARLRGANGFVRMVDYHRMFSGWDTDVRKATAQTTNWSDDTTWSDGRGWADGYLPPFVTAGEDRVRGDVSLLLHGFPANLVRVLRAGDLFEVRQNGFKPIFGQLHEVTRDCRTNTLGETRVEFEPGLRAGLVTGDQIVLRYPSSVFRLASDSEGVINRSLGNLGSLGLSLVEVLP